MKEKIKKIDSRNFLRLSVQILRAVGAWPHLGDFTSIGEASYHFLSLAATTSFLIELGTKIYILYYYLIVKWESLELFLEETIITITCKIFLFNFSVLKD